MASAGRLFARRRCLWFFGKRTHKPNSVLCGHSSRRSVTARAHQRPTRRFRHLHEAHQRRRPVAGDPARAALPHRADAQPASGSKPRLPSLFGLAPCGVYHACPITGCSGALLPHLFTLTPSCPGAVCSLWHWPSTGLDARVPDVIRHTALRSSDFPPPEPSACASDSGSDRPVLLPALVYRESSIRWPARQSPTNFLHRASAFRHPFAYGQAVSGEPVFAPSRHQALEVRKH